MDVDGVVANFTGHLLNIIGSELTPADVTVWQVLDLLKPSEKKEATAILNEPEFWRSQPVIEGAQDGIAQIKKHHEIFWVTSPWIGCEGWEAARRWWLKDNFGVDHKHVAPLASKYIVVGDFIVDDKASHVDEWLEHHDGQGFLFDAPYNQDSKLQRMNWNDIPDPLIHS